ncbi:hypothetical protein [Psychrobacter jeotgali]|uniref:hypothetical protein n=1 Tax=Psychrobacter jeotgali TaxID=179010 RepID=UPI00191944AE|nr:hypothetical protein [Psychrobacter jeotgali]
MRFDAIIFPFNSPHQFLLFIQKVFSIKRVRLTLTTTLIIALVVIFNHASLAATPDATVPPLVISENTTISSSEIPSADGTNTNNDNDNKNAAPVFDSEQGIDAKAAIKNSSAVRQDLSRIVTSDVYANIDEIKSWEAIEKPKESSADVTWLRELLKFIFGDGFNTDGFINVFSLLLKVLLVATLIGFIIWVLRRAGYLAGWVNPLRANSKRRTSIDSNVASYSEQGWEQLPDHEQLPKRVKQLLAEDKLTQAASLLYRGSLRWLATTQQLTINVAATEKQCLAQIEQLAQIEDLAVPTGHSNHSNSSVNANSAINYVSQIISLWIQSAYDKRTRAQHAEQLSAQLGEKAGIWLEYLPPISEYPKGTGGADVQ